MAVCEWLGDNQKRAMGLAGKSAENCLSLTIVVCSTLHNVDTLIGVLGCRNQARSVGRRVWIEQDTDFRQVRHKLMQELNPLSCDGKIPNDKPGNIAPRAGKAFRESKSDRIDQLGKNDRNGRR